MYLPKAWFQDEARRQKAGVPKEAAFATKPAIALAQIERLLDQGAPKHCVLADAGYGTDTAFRERLSEPGLTYVVGVTGQVNVWPPGHAPLGPAAYSGRGNVPTRQRLGKAAHQRPQSMKELAHALTSEQWHSVEWREGSNFSLRARFARVRVHAADRDHQRDELRPEQWARIEWPEGHKDPMKYWMSTLPQDMPIERMVLEAKMRWRIERDYQDLKQDLGLGDSEGRGWRGFHHHASLAIAADGLLMAQQLRYPDAEGKKTPHESKNLPYQRMTSLAAAPRTQRHVPSFITSLQLGIAAALRRTLPRCPCCLHSKTRAVSGADGSYPGFQR